MSIKSQEGHMRQLALLLTTDLGCIFDERESGPNGSKKAFLNVGKVFLRALAKDLGLHEVITEYFVLGATNSVYKFSQHIAGDHVVLEFCLSPDYYEPLYFANSLVDLLRYCQCSIRRIEAKLAERETENTRKEAA